MAVLAGLFLRFGGYEHRYVIVNGPDFVVVGRHMFMEYVREGACMKHDMKSYPDVHVTIHRCYV